MKRSLLLLALLLGCAEAPPVPANRAAMPLCDKGLEGEAVRGCRCSWSVDWGWAWVSVPGGYHGASDWCPGAQS